MSRANSTIDAWAERVRALRELFVPQKWTHDTPMGLPRIMSPDGEVAIIVATGDAATGSAAMEPRTKRSIGPIVMHSVEANQLGLFGDSTRVSDGPITWVLLTHRVKGKEVVQAELSLPSTVDVENYVVGWETRWIFGSIPLDSPPKRDYEEPMKSIVNVKAR
ncbi:MAG: hypothetical protein IH885_04705 [Myxococcales bacterium]|nr:hypothetical protein [Myxococcales bacterium]